jgi:hypothetical protein
MQVADRESMLVGTSQQRASRWSGRLPTGLAHRLGSCWWRTVWPLLLGLALVIPVGLLVARGQFDGLYGQDAFAYYDYAIGPFRERLLQLQPLPPFFWPPGYPLLVAILSLLIGTTPLAGQVVSLISGGLVPVFTVLFAREVWPDEPSTEGRVQSPTLGPLVAGLLVALHGQLWQSSAVVMSDTTSLAAATLGMWGLARNGRTPDLRWLMLGVVALGFAWWTRWIYGLVALSGLLFALWQLGRPPIGVALRHGLLAGGVAAVLVLPMMPSVIAALTAPAGDLAPFAGNLQIYAWSPLHALQRDFFTADGHLSYRLPNGLYYALIPGHWYFFTPLLAPFLLPGLWVVARSRPRSAPLLLGWPVMVYGFHAGAAWQNFRFGLAYLPPLAVLAAIGFLHVWRVMPRPARWVPGLVLLVGLVGMMIGGFRLTNSFIERKTQDLATLSWVETQVPPDSRLVTFSYTLTFRHYSRLEVEELYEARPSLLASWAADDRPLFLFVDVTSMETQWIDRSPGENYRWLRDGPGLVAIGQRGPAALFKVGRDGG